MNTFPDRTQLTHTALLYSMLMMAPLLMMASSVPSWAETSEDAKVKQAADGSQAEGTDEASTKSVEEDSEMELDTAASEPPLITNPMRMSFRITKMDRGISPDSRKFVAPRVITLTAIGPIAHLNESVWRGKRLAVFHTSSVQLTSDGVSVGTIEEKVGEIKIQSVYQSTLQAIVVLDDITRGLQARRGEARVVMIGDVARLERPIKAPPKPKVRRYAKPKKRSPYEREDMRWRL